MAETTINMRKAKGLTLTVKFNITREWRVRKFIAVKLISLAAWMLGCGIKFESHQNEEQI